MLELIKRYKFEDGVFKIKSGPHAGLIVDENKIAGELMKLGISYEAVPDKRFELASLCTIKPKVVLETDDLSERVNEILEQQDFIQDFKFLKVNDSSFLYHFNGPRATMIQVGYPKTKDWINILLEYCNEDIVDLKNKLAPILSPKAHFRVSLEDVAEILVNSLDFSKRQDLKSDLLGDIKPVTLSTSEEISLYKVDYEPINEPKLNPYMQEFLSRVSDHEYLCAIIWLTFNGQKSPYVVYLYGTGGEGKSTFLNILAQYVGSAAAFQKHNQFSNFNMHGKAMILLTENTDCFLLQDQVVKQITGNSLVHCEQKNKGSFTSNLPGTLYADANRMLKLKGEEAEFRRLRIFKVKKPQYSEQLDMNTYKAFMSQDFNSFLNYCRICFEKVGSKVSWLVPASATQQADFRALTDKGFLHNSEMILTKIFKDLGLEYQEKGELDSNLFWQSFYKLPEAKERYLCDNLRDYLFLHKQVSEVGSKMFGLQQKPSNHTTFVLPIN